MNIVRKFKKNRILLIGDFMIDKYIHGACHRIAPEASVPVIDIDEKRSCLGGAGNVAANLRALGSEVLFCTVVGNDDILPELKYLLRSATIDEQFLVLEDSRKTIVKTRVSSDSQLIVRFDDGTESVLEANTEDRLIKHIERAYPLCDAVLISDYNKGVLTDKVIDKLRELRSKNKKILAVDAKSYERYKMLKPDFIKPNYQEGLEITGESYSRLRKEQVQQWSGILAERTGAKNIILTMDKDGIAHFRQSEYISHYDVEQVIAPQVSGAGDSFISAFLLSISAGANIEQSMQLAVHAAHAAIQKREKTAICASADIQEKLVNASKYIPLGELKRIVGKHQKEGKNIVFTNGCFDILHCGHVKYLAKAKEMGDILVVGINNDESIKRLKGSTRPINNLQERIEVLKGLACIDYIVSFGKVGDDTPIQLIKTLKPQVFVKGGDYTYKYLPEKVTIDEIGCKLAFVPFTDNKSTTSTIKQIQETSQAVYAS